MKKKNKVVALILLGLFSSLYGADAPAKGVAEADLPNLTGNQNVTIAIPEGVPGKDGLGTSSGQSVSVEADSISSMYPLDRRPGLKTKNPQLEQDTFEIEIQRNMVNKVLKEQRRYERLMGGIQDVSLLQKPITRPFAAIDTIRITTEYMTTLVFPKEYKVQYAKSTSEFLINEFDQNVLLIQPKKDYQSGSMAIGLSDGNGNTVVNIIVEKYLPGDILHDRVEDRYLSCGEYISTMIRYINPPKLNDLDILKRYFALYGDKSLKNFPSSGAFDVITIANMPFYIIRDDKYGTIDYRNASFRIALKYEQFIEKQRNGGKK